MTIDTLGSVGIGTTAPSSKLDITSNSLGVTQTTTSGLALVNTTAAAAGAQQISPALRWSASGWKTDATAASQAVDFRSFVVPVQGTANPTGYLTFQSSVNGAAYGDRMVITTAGNVGIGTNSPEALLTLSSPTAPVLQIDPGTDLNADPTLHLKDTGPNTGFRISYINSSGSTNIDSLGNVDTYNINFRTQVSGTPINALSMNSNGVSIGQTGVPARLFITGNRSFASWTTQGRNFAMNNNTLTDSSGSGTIATQVASSFGVPTFSSTNARTVTNAATLYIAGAPTAGTNTTITNAHALHVAAGNSYFAGSVGIGTATPSSFKLQVAGDIGPDANTSYNLGSTALRWGCVWTSDGSTGTCASDANLKDRINDLEFGDALAKVAGLRPRTFTFNDDPDQNLTLGLIAQEVEGVAPELVVTDPATGLKAVRYGALPWLVLSAVKELAGKVAYLTEAVSGFGRSFRTERLCLEEVCITKSELQQLLDFRNAPPAAPAAPEPPATPPPAALAADPDDDAVDPDAILDDPIVDAPALAPIDDPLPVVVE